MIFPEKLDIRKALQTLNIRGTADWKEYSIQLRLEPNGRQIVFGFLVSGAGRAWADSLQLLADGQPIAQTPDAQPSILVTDREFDNGSKVNVTGYRMDANIRLLQNVLIGAQQTAITRNTHVQVMFDASNHRVRILLDTDNDGTVSVSETMTYRALDNARFLTPSTTLDGALAFYLTGPGVIETGNPLQRAVRIAPNGSLSGDVVVYIGSTSDRPNDMRALTIIGATARTAFWSHGGGAWAKRNY